MLLQEPIATSSPVACLGSFYDADVAADQTNVQLLLAGSAANDGVVMPKAGYIIGLTGSLSAAASAGSLTVGVTVDGTELASTTQTVTTGQEVRATFATDPARRVEAGAQIGVEITTDGSWNGTTADLDVQVWVVFDDWEF
jgi:hypothetical protein